MLQNQNQPNYLLIRLSSQSQTVAKPNQSQIDNNVITFDNHLKTVLFNFMFNA